MDRSTFHGRRAAAFLCSDVEGDVILIPALVRSFCVLAAVCASLSLHAESAHEALVRIGAVWSTGERERFAPLLAPSFPAAPLHLARLTARFRARCLTVRHFTAKVLSADDTRAAGLLTFHILEQPRTGALRELVEDVEVELAASEGTWQIVKWTRIVDAAALRLAKADPAGDLTAQMEPAVPDRELVRALARQALELSNVSRMAESRNAAAVASAIAAQTNEEAARVIADFAQIVANTRPTEDPAERRRRVLEVHERALRSGDPDSINSTKAYVGRLYLDVDESSREAERLFLHMVEHEDEYSEPKTMPLAATNAGVTRLTRGDYRGALQLFSRALARSIELDDRQGSAYLRLHIGRIYDRQNDLELALAEYRQGLEQAVPGSIPEALIRQALARSLRRLGKPEEAEREQQAALALSRKLERPGLIAMTLVAMSESALLAGNADAAVAHASEAVTLARKVGYRPAEIDALLTLAEIERTRGRHRAALSWIAEVQRLDSTLEDLGFAMPVALMLAARCHHALGDAAEERRALEQAIEHIERSRTLVAGDERQLRLFFQPLSAAYTMMAAAAARAGDVDGALTFGERGRARVLFDLLERGGDAPHATVPATVPKLTRDDLDSIVEPGTVLLEYIIGEDETQLLVIRRGGNVTAYRIETGRAELERRTAALVRRIAGRDLGYREDAREMYELLLAPAATDLAGAKLLGICADGPLWSLPFEVLIGPDDRFLTERTATFYIPSISSYRTLRGRGRPERQSVLIVADAPHAQDASPLPEAREEANELAKIYGRSTVVRVGASATERAVKVDAGLFSILHFAVHGVLDDRDPMYSHIVLGAGGGDNGKLEAWELAGLALRAEMVVLSACDTGRGRVYPGEGVVGMSWALLVAGSRSAVVSHWAVSSRATRQLMVDFHRRYRAGGGKAEALRQARLARLRDGATRHPFYWSAFVLVGS